MRVGEQHDLEQHGGRIRCRAGFIIFEATIETRQVYLVIEQMVQRMLKSARQKLLLQVHRDQSRTRVDVFVARHLLLQNISP